REFFEVAIEDRVSTGAASPVAVLTSNTPASRIRIERLSKSSVVLARCPDADQNIYEPLFREATDLMSRYRTALGLKTVFRSAIAWLSTETSGKSPASKPATAKPAAQNTSK